MTRARTATLALLTLAALLLTLVPTTAVRAEEEERTALNFEGPIAVEQLIKEVMKALDLPLVKLANPVAAITASENPCILERSEEHTSELQSP